MAVVVVVFERSMHIAFLQEKRGKIEVGFLE